VDRVAAVLLSQVFPSFKLTTEKWKTQLIDNSRLQERWSRGPMWEPHVQGCVLFGFSAYMKTGEWGGGGVTPL
jgi:hypothetical protein